MRAADSLEDDAAQGEMDAAEPPAQPFFKVITGYAVIHCSIYLKQSESDC